MGGISESHAKLPPRGGYLGGGGILEKLRFCSVYKPLGAYIRAHFILVNDWAVLYSSRAYTRVGRIHETLQYRDLRPVYSVTFVICRMKTQAVQA